MAKDIRHKQWSEITEGERAGTLGCLIVFALIVLFGFLGSTLKKESPPAPKPETDAETFARASGVDVARADGVLSRLQIKCIQTKSELAAQTWEAHKLLTGAGVASNIIDIAEGLDAVIPAHQAISYSEWCAA
jgi:hypothetical protein